jgi:hypothetical protein
MRNRLLEVVRDHGFRADILRAALSHYPDAPADLKKLIEAALKLRCDTARKAALAVSSSDELTWFINEVYDRVGSGGELIRMRVKVVRVDTDALRELDRRVAESTELRARTSPVADYFGTYFHTTTEKLERAVKEGVNVLFPSDVVDVYSTIQNGPDIELSYVIRPKVLATGTPSFYSAVDEKGRAILGAAMFPGIEFGVVANLSVPDSPAPRRVAFTATPAPEIAVSGRDDAGRVYQAMAESASNDLTRKLLLALGGRAPQLDVPQAERGPRDQLPPQAVPVAP